MAAATTEKNPPVVDPGTRMKQTTIRNLLSDDKLKGIHLKQVRKWNSPSSSTEETTKQAPKAGEWRTSALWDQWTLGTNTYIKIMVNLIYRPSTQLPGYIPAWDGNCILFCSILVFSSAELPFTHRLKSSTKAIEPLSRKWGLQLGSHCKTGKESRRGGKPEGSPGLGCSSVPIQIDLHKSLLFFLCRGIDPSNNVSGYLSFS